MMKSSTAAIVSAKAEKDNRFLCISNIFKITILGHRKTDLVLSIFQYFCILYCTLCLYKTNAHNSFNTCKENKHVQAFILTKNQFTFLMI